MTLLKEIAAVIMGQSPPSSAYNAEKNGISFYQGKSDFGAKYPSPTKWCTQPSRTASKNDILMSVRAPVGPVNISTETCCIGRGLCAIRAGPKMDPIYLYYFLKSKEVEIERLGTGSTFKAINRKDIEQIEVPVPSLSEQKRVVSVLERVEKIGEKKKTINTMSETLSESIFLKMFGNPITNSMGFETMPLNKLCVNIYGGGTPARSNPDYFTGKIPWVSPKDMKTERLYDSEEHITQNAIDNSSTNLVPKNSLLMVIRSGILKRKLPLSINFKEVCLNQDLKGFAFNTSKTNSQFMLSFFKIYEPTILKNVRAVTADNLEFNEIKSMKVICPPINLQNKFAKEAELISTIKEKQKKSEAETRKLFESIIKKSFQNKVES